MKRKKISAKIHLLEAIEQSLIQACKNHFGKADNVHVTIDPETCDFQYMQTESCRICRRSGIGNFPADARRSHPEQKSADCTGSDPV